MNSRKVRVRFAPSPTGYLHIGNARTALFNYLYARHSGGDFILRIEDTDLERSRPEYEKALIEDLRWLGLQWDEGPDVGGPLGPYRQSERLDVYRGYLDTFLAAGKAYPCFCTAEELQARRDAAMSAGRPPEYDGRCRALTGADRDRLAAEGRRVSYRYCVPGEKVVVEDLVRGRVEFDAALIGDPVIMKSDGTPTFHFAVTVDDCLMGVTCVLRGEGHLPNAPIQVLLSRDLGFSPPVFAHMSQTLAPDGGKLSKRRGAMSLREFRDEGRLPQALVNYMALLGWSPGDNREIFTLDEAVALFDIGSLTKSAAFFDPAKFSFVCRRHLQTAGLEYLAGLAAGFLERQKIRIDDPDVLRRLVDLARERIEKMSDFPAFVRPYIGDVEMDEEALAVLKAPDAGKVLEVFAERLSAAGAADEPAVRQAFHETQRLVAVKGRSLYIPVRVALTGSTSGAEIVQIMPILGVEAALARLRSARERFASRA